MSKQPAVIPHAQTGSGDPPSSSGARGADVAPSQPETGRIRYAKAQSDAAGDRPRRRVTYMEGSFEAAEQPPSHDDGAGDTARPQARTQRVGPTYTPVSQRRREPAADQQPQVYGEYPRAGGREEPPAASAASSRRRGRAVPGPGEATPPQATGHSAAAGGALPPVGSLPSPGTAASTSGGIPESSGGAPPVQARWGWGGLKTNKTIERVSTLQDEPVLPSSGGALALPRRGGLKTNKTIERVSTLQNEPTPSSGGAPAPALPRRGGLKTKKTIERVSTLQNEPVGLGLDGSGGPEPPATQAHDVPQHPQPEPEPRLPQQPEGPYVYQPPKQSSSSSSGTKRPAGASPTLIRRKEKAKKLLAVCLTLCCILFWLLVVCIGLAILVVYLLYHPKGPRIHVSTATLNAGYIDELPPPHLGKALNSDLYVLAAIYNPNAKVDVALRYMQLDLYFQGRLIGTQAVWPPLYQKPGDSALRSVHLVVSEVVMTQEDAEVWKNVTTGGGLVEMHLQGKFYVQLNFGRWLPFRYTVRPTCALWLDPPPAGALRRARCSNR
ncbi:hypothetical protein Zm00014a_036018 [Zea mays]|uniref:Late embryogenesis abundant (LEA) hydroxyproline-rich glycoprotein family n=2 Tax=Zea mays TaxID=4577 RepID=A0A1D6N3X0_MAIZE|nr:Late embryogenesis abundant (LEA) hydroxyproline-rich glycoprotein family [Zea mays]PWZ33769.1 hypothetical protein Zm00014a_036018 [Zea mays]